MQPDQATVVIRPRTLGAVCDLAFRFVFRLAPKLYACLLLLFLAPALFGAAALRYGSGADWLPIWLSVVGYVTVFQGAFTLAAGQLMFAQKVSLKHLLSLYTPRFLTTAWLATWTRLLVALLLPFFGLGLVFWIRYAYVFEATLLEGARGRQATRRSAELARDQAGTHFVMLCMLLCIQVGFVVSFEVLGRGIVEFLLLIPDGFEPLQHTGGSPYALLGFLCSVPFTTTTRFLAYVDGRTRHDGWDLQVAFMGLERHAAAGVRG